MNQKLKYSLLLIVFLSFSYLSGCSISNSKTDSSSNTASPVTTTPGNSSSTSGLTTDNSTAIGAKGARQDSNLGLEKMLTYAIQDEYLAYAEYEYVIGTFGDQKPFSNIIKAEEKHISLLTPLFTAHKVVLPTNNAKDFVYPPKNVSEALEVGVQAEIDNIAMYESFLKRELPDDVRTVFTELRDASKLHLDAFQKNLNK